MDDIFVTSFCNMIGVIKKFLDPEDIFLGKNPFQPFFFNYFCSQKPREPIF